MRVHDATQKLLQRDYPQIKFRQFIRSVATLEIIEARRQSSAYMGALTFRPELARGNDKQIDWGWYQATMGLPQYRVIPDGFFPDFYNQMLVVFEVEDSHALTMEKLQSYYDLNSEHLIRLGWGISLIGVDRWGSRRPIPIFNYVHASRLDKLAFHPVLAAEQYEAEIEFRYAKAACEAHKLWNNDAMFRLIADARAKVDYRFWRQPETATTFERLLKDSRVSMARQEESESE